MREHYDIVIAGSGLFASVFAHEAMKDGKSVLVVEKRNHIGGNIYTEKKDGIYLHRYGAHIFHTSNEEVWNYVNSLVKFHPFINSPIAFYKDESYNLPFNMNTFSKMWGIHTPEEARAIITSQQGELEGEPRNLEEQAIHLVGRDIYTKLIKGYTEKQWGRPCSELPSFIIKRLPVRYTWDNNYFNDPWQGIPDNGYTELIEKLLDGADIVLGENFNDDKEKWTGMGDRVLYTGPLDEYFDSKLGKLEYRSLRFENVRYEEENHQGVAVVNYTDREVPWTRTIEHKHFGTKWQRALPVTWVSREYSSDYSTSGEPYYPINDEKNDELWKKYKALADEDKKLIIGGRLAEYKYYDMDKTVEAALSTYQRCR